MVDRTGNPDFMNGIPELLVLELLSREEMYGYEIMKRIRNLSDEKISFSEGCIYPLLHRLEEQGLIDSRSEKVEGRERFYYSLNETGQEKLNTMRDDWETAVDGVASVLESTG